MTWITENLHQHFFSRQPKLKYKPENESDMGPLKTVTFKNHLLWPKLELYRYYQELSEMSLFPF